MTTRHVFRFAAVLPLLAALALPAAAQHVRVAPAPFVEAPATWPRYLGLQLRASLASPSPSVRAQAIEQVTYFARRHPGLDLAATGPALTAVYRDDPQPSFRLAAVAVLHALGDVDGMQAVRRDVVRQSHPSVQHASLGASRSPAPSAEAYRLSRAPGPAASPGLFHGAADVSAGAAESAA